MISTYLKPVAQLLLDRKQQTSPVIPIQEVFCQGIKNSVSVPLLCMTKTSVNQPVARAALASESRVACKQSP